MSGCCTVLVALVSVAASLVPAFAQPAPEVIVDVRVHGNHTTPDEEVLKLAGLSVGAPATNQRIDDAAQALRSSGRFESVDIRKRFASIDDPSQIVLIIVVDERPGVSEDDLVPGPMKRLRASGMWLPILRYEDGYGLTYGARMSFVGTAGSNSRISFPLSWGGERRAAAEIERTFERGPLTRLAAAVGIDRRENPFYDEPQTRRVAEARAERRFAGWLRAGAHVGFSRVTFGGQEDDDEIAVGGNLTADTRVDPAFPRNAVHAVASVEHLHFERPGGGESLRRRRAWLSRADRCDGRRDARVGVVRRWLSAALREGAPGWRVQRPRHSRRRRRRRQPGVDVGRDQSAVHVAAQAGAIWRPGLHRRRNRVG